MKQFYRLLNPYENMLFSNSYACFCGNSYPLIQMAEIDCNSNCTGNFTQKCGGFSKNSVYCLDPPCETKEQQRLIGINSNSFTPSRNNFTFGITNKLSQITLICLNDSTVRLRVNYSDGQSIETNFMNDLESMSDLVNITIYFANKKLSSINDKLQICVQDLLTTIITCSGCDSSTASYTFFVSSLNTTQLIAFYDSFNSTLYSLKQFGVNWQGRTITNYCQKYKILFLNSILLTSRSACF